MKVNYIIIFVSNMKMSIGFYKNILGMKLIFETPEWTEFEGEGATIALHKSDVKNSDDVAADKAVAGRCRPGLSVFNLDEFHKRMIENNVTCFQEPKEVFGDRIAQYLDPDGLAISVSEQKRNK